MSTTINTIIVLFTLYLGLSLVISHLNEWFTSAFNMRGRTLFDGILNLLAGSQQFAKAIMTHPLITGTVPDPGGEVSTTKEYRPPYIAPRSFSTALWQAVAVATYPQGGGQPSINFSTVAQAPTTFLPDLRTAATRVPQSALRLQLFALLDTAQGDYNKLLSATDDWYNRQMDRVAGWFKKYYASWFSFIASFVIVFGLGIDTFTVAQTSVKQTTAAAATAGDAARIIASATPAPGGAPSTEQDKAFSLLLSNDQIFQSIINPPPLDKKKIGAWGTASHLCGMLITFFAALLGAPFWFNLLSLFVNVRSTGPKPDTSTSQ
jgi:hypothetical protein